MNILFICKWNRFRSKAAETIFNKTNKNPKHKSKSSGLFPGVPITSDIIDAGKRIGISINKKQRGTSHELMMWSDRIIVIADDIPKTIFKEIIENDKKEVEIWKIKDIEGTNVDKRKKTMEEIESRVKKLLKKMQ